MDFEICAIQNNIVTLRTGLCTLYKFQSPYTVLCRAVQYSEVKYSTVKYSKSTVKYSTVQLSTVQYSNTVKYSAVHGGSHLDHHCRKDGNRTNSFQMDGGWKRMQESHHHYHHHHHHVRYNGRYSEHHCGAHGAHYESHLDHHCRKDGNWMNSFQKDGGRERMKLNGSVPWAETMKTKKQ